jgi:hypothetical protein
VCRQGCVKRGKMCAESGVCVEWTRTHSNVREARMHSSGEEVCVQWQQAKRGWGCKDRVSAESGDVYGAEGGTEVWVGGMHSSGATICVWCRQRRVCVCVCAKRVCAKRGTESRK